MIVVREPSVKEQEDLTSQQMEGRWWWNSSRLFLPSLLFLL